MPGRVGGGSADPKSSEELVHRGREPTRMPRLTGDREVWFTSPHHGEERLGDSGFESQTGWQLDQQYTDFGAQRVQL
jgi:hypothetical protein